jgi:pimeloyl-ACP methyl ester carboxylesterase
MSQPADINDPAIAQFLKAAPGARLSMLLDDSLADGLRRHLGEEAYADLRRLAERTAAGKHLRADIPPNMIFVPGVMGSLLASKMGGVWWIDARARDYIDSLRLSPDGTQDAMPAHGIKPVGIDISYMRFFGAINNEKDFNYELFPYDWRKPLALSAAALRDLVNEVHAANDRKPVHLVAHSMGGLMARTALMLHGDEMWPKIGRIVFLGGPHYGSPAIAGYLKNHLWGFDLMALLGIYLSAETFRTLWGVLSLLPAPRGIYPGTRADGLEQWAGGDADDPYAHPCVNFDIYDAAAWELGLSGEQTDQLQRVLDGADEAHRRLYEWHRGLSEDRRGRMACIVGVGYKTLFRIANRGRLTSWMGMEKVMSRREGDPHREGDGRVPMASATLEEIGDTRYVYCQHGDLPLVPAVYTDVFLWLNNKSMSLSKKPEWALQTHLSGGDGAPSWTRVAGVSDQTEDPGYWNLAPPDPVQLEGLRARLESEQLPDFNKIRLL